MVLKVLSPKHKSEKGIETRILISVPKNDQVEALGFMGGSLEALGFWGLGFWGV